jgi:hypothetical protein
MPNFNVFLLLDDNAGEKAVDACNKAKDSSPIMDDAEEILLYNILLGC